jgi:hypothetical protein
MDETEFVSIFCTELARATKGMRDMYSFYEWQDKRSGSVVERLQLDAQTDADYRRMFQL